MYKTGNEPVLHNAFQAIPRFFFVFIKQKKTNIAELETLKNFIDQLLRKQYPVFQ